MIYRNLRSSKEREAYIFLGAWRRETLLAAANGRTISCSDQIKSLRAVLDALHRLDSEFFQSLAKAIHIQGDRISLSKDKDVGERLGSMASRIQVADFRESAAHGARTQRGIRFHIPFGIRQEA